ncbi:MAG: hypothetical protein UW43_C0002G0055 [Candidatus Yanofskybacteria bacterium GW2011_GWA1_44_21]|nr:MAG: hypothetical protein UW43_C0002G0055 [Candidatus Yanofskybacteria bacterium GW2011_GWA1_44_21]
MVISATDFEEDNSNPGWQVRLGQGQLREIIKHGRYRGHPATLIVAGEADVNLFDSAADWQKYEKIRQTQNVSLALRAPTVLRAGGTRFNSQAFDYVIHKKLESNISPVREIARPSDEEIAKVTLIYWRTYFVFKDFKPPQLSAPDYFRQRFDKWFGAEGKPETLSPDELRTLSRYRDRIIEKAGQPMMVPSYFFAHFGNTDIRFSSHYYYVLNSPIVERGPIYPPAAWIWNDVLHLVDKFDADTLLFHCLRWLRGFVNAGSNYFAEAWLAECITLNLLERLTASILVDLPHQRSPFKPEMSPSDYMDVKHKLFELMSKIDRTLDHALIDI